jgi:hypothetical protein
MLLVTVAAFVERRNSICTAGQWQFRLYPLGQTCGSDMSTAGRVARWLGAGFLTLTALAAVVCCVIVVVYWVRDGRVTGFGRWLVYAVGVGLVVGVLLEWRYLDTYPQPAVATGVELGIVGMALAGFVLGFVITGLAGFFFSVLRAARSEPGS